MEIDPGLRIGQSDVEAPRGPGLEPAAREGSDAAAGDFGEMLVRGIEQVADMQNEVRGQLEGLVTGETEDVHGVLLAMGKAEVAFSLMLEIRNRLVDTWRELTRIQV